MKKMLKRLCTGFLALATVVTALPTTPVHAESKQYWTESAERVGIIEKVMNDGSIGSTFNEGYMKVEGETAYCIPKSAQLIGTYEKITKGETVKMKQIFKKPSYYLLSQAMDGDEKAIEKILAFYDPYISKCCLRPLYDEYGKQTASS